MPFEGRLWGFKSFTLFPGLMLCFLTKDQDMSSQHPVPPCRIFPRHSRLFPTGTIIPNKLFLLELALVLWCFIIAVEK